ncbi:MAG: hypothetical protein AB7P03_16255, partial [Kofleriaceae bacterium]
MRVPLATVLLFLAACGSRAGSNSDDDDDDGGNGDGGNGDAMAIDAPKYAELWYAIDDQLVYIPLNISN